MNRCVSGPGGGACVELRSDSSDSSPYYILRLRLLPSWRYVLRSDSTVSVSSGLKSDKYCRKSKNPIELAHLILSQDMNQSGGMAVTRAKILPLFLELRPNEDGMFGMAAESGADGRVLRMRTTWKTLTMMLRAGSKKMKKRQSPVSLSTLPAIG